MDLVRAQTRQSVNTLAQYRVGADRLELIPASQFSTSQRQASAIFVESQGTSHPFQLPDWSAEETSYYAVMRDETRIRLFARCDTVWLLGRRFQRLQAMTITRGPVCDDPDLMRASLKGLAYKCRSQGFLYLDINPELADSDADQLCAWLRDQGWIASSGERTSLRVDLRPSLEEIQATFRKTTRYEIRRAESAEVRIEQAGDDLCCERFLSLYSAMAREKAFAPEPEPHIRYVLSWLAKEHDRGALLLASHHGEILGGVVVVCAGLRCWYVWGATKKRAQVNVGHFLQWRAMNWAKQRGCTEYDLGGYREGATDGPALFKRGFSENVVRFLPIYRCVTNPAAYATFQLVQRGVHTARRLAGFKKVYGLQEAR
jgi:hypothetical protein